LVQTAMNETLFNLRMRSGYEAADAGILLWKERAGLLLAFFALPALVIAAAFLLLNHQYIRGNDYGAAGVHLVRFVWFVLVLWYLKPLFDRPALAVLSKIFFNRNAGLKDITKNFKSNFRGLAGDLLWRRLSLRRGVMLPLRVLERPGRAKLKERQRELQKGGLNFGVHVSLICLALEITLFAGGVFFILMLFDFAGIKLTEKISVCIYTVLYFCNYCVVETLYVSICFAVYINSRVITEGWDLEIIFREPASQNETTIKRGINDK